MKKSYLMAVVVALAACNTTPNPDSNTPDFIAGTNYLSDVLGGTGFSKDSTNGKILSIAGVAYRKGVAVQNDSALGLNTGQHCTSFSAYVGLDSNTAKTGDKIKFELLVDGKSVFATQNLTNKNGAVFTGPIDISKASHLEFKTVGTGVANWANAKLNCQSVGVQIAATDTTAPELDSVSPWEQAEALSSSVALDFMEPMDIATVKITVNPPLQFKAPVFWNSDNTYARFTPTTLMQPNTTYVVTVEGKDVAGNALIAGTYNLQAWQFTTVALSGTGDDIAPELDSVAPWGQGIDPNSTLSLDFTESIKTDSLQVFTEPPIEFQKPIFWNSGDNYAALTPTKPLSPGIKYTVRVLAKDLAGNNLVGGSVAWSFTTAGTPPTLWGFTRSFGSREYQNFFADSQKNIYTLSINYKDVPGTHEFYINKWSPSGQAIWEKMFNGDFADFRLIADQNLVVVVGNYVYNNNSEQYAYTARRYNVGAADGLVSAPILRNADGYWGWMRIKPDGRIDLLENSAFIQLDKNFVELRNVPNQGAIYSDDSSNLYGQSGISVDLTKFYKFDADFNELWGTELRGYGFASLAPSTGDQFIWYPSYGNVSIDELVRLDSAGKLRWRLSTKDAQLTNNTSGTIYLTATGCVNGVQDSYVLASASTWGQEAMVKIDSNGKVLWVRTGNRVNSIPAKIQCLADGGVQAAFYSSPDYVNRYMTFVEYDKDGYQR